MCQQDCILSLNLWVEHAFKLTRVYCWNSAPSSCHTESATYFLAISQGSFSAFRDFFHSLEQSFHPLYAKSETMGWVILMVQISLTLPTLISPLWLTSVHLSVTASSDSCHKTRPTWVIQDIFLKLNWLEILITSAKFSLPPYLDYCIIKYPGNRNLWEEGIFRNLTGSATYSFSSTLLKHFQLLIEYLHLSILPKVSTHQI